MYQIELARVLPGAIPFSHGNINDTYRGLILTTNGQVRSAILKDLSTIELANELLATCLIRSSGLPTPEVYLTLATPNNLMASKGPIWEGEGRLVFASVDVKTPNITRRAQILDDFGQRLLLQEFASWVDLGKLYGFDAWVANIDRHPGNLLFGNSDEVWLIDHGHCFTGPTWLPADLISSQMFQNKLAMWLTPYLQLSERTQLGKTAGEFAAALLRIKLEDILKVSRVEALLQPNFVTAVEQFLKERATKVVFHANSALKIPSLI